MKDTSGVQILIPKYRGNESLPEDEQIVVHYTMATYREMQRIGGRFSTSKRGIQRSEAELYKKNVSKIENYSIDGQAITNGEEMVGCEAFPFALIDEIQKALLGKAPLQVDEDTVEDPDVVAGN